MSIEILDKGYSPWFGWLLQDNPKFWEDNGFEKIDISDFHYYGCEMAKVNKHPVYRKKLYINYDLEEDSMVEVFSCDYGVVQHWYLMAIHTWNNAGGSKYSLDILKQVGNIDTFNKTIMEYLGDDLDGGTYILKTKFVEE